MKLNKNISWLLPLSVLTILSMSGCGGDGENGASSDRNLLYELSYMPLLPTDPTDPAEPTYPTYPVDPTYPTDPVAPPSVDPQDPGFGVDPQDPGFGVDPQDPGFGVDPQDPGFDVDPQDPGFGVDPQDPDKNLPPIADIKVTYDGIIDDNGALYISDGDTTTVYFWGSDSKDQDSLIQPIIHTWSAGSYSTDRENVHGQITCEKPYCSPTVTHPTCTYEVNLKVYDGELSDDATVMVIANFEGCSNIVPQDPTDVCKNDGILNQITAVRIDPSSYTMHEKDTKTLIAWGLANGTEYDVSRCPGTVWETSDQGIAKVGTGNQQAGKVTAVDTGTATISGKYKGPNNQVEIEALSYITVE